MKKTLNEQLPIKKFDAESVKLIPVIITPDGEEIIIPGLAETIGDNWIHESEVDFSSVDHYYSTWEKGPNGKWRTICRKKSKKDKL